LVLPSCAHRTPSAIDSELQISTAVLVAPSQMFMVWLPATKAS
jgi:hypothetical protein